MLSSRAQPRLCGRLSLRGQAAAARGGPRPRVCHGSASPATSRSTAASAHSTPQGSQTPPAQFVGTSMDKLKKRQGGAGGSSLHAADEAGGHATAAPHGGGLGAVLLCVAVASCGAFSFGYHLGIVNGPLGAIASSLGFASNASLQGLVVSSLLAGAAVGSLAGSALADSLGRRRAFLLDAAPMLAGSLLCAGATRLSTILLGRLLAGFGIGLSSALVPLYISEIAPTRLRGTLGSVNQVLICLGILAALVVNVVLPATAWGTMFALAAVPAGLLALGMLVCPESPVWLQLKGRHREAEDMAVQLWGADGPAQLGSADKGPALAAPRAEPSWGEVLGSRAARIGVALFLFQQFSGINAIVYFSSSVFAKAGVGSEALASAAVGVTNVLGSVVATGLMDRAGRKQLLVLSYAGMGASMLAMAAGLSLPFLAHGAGTIALLGTLCYIAFFAFGAGPVPGLLVPELTASRMRGRVVSLAMVTHWVCNLIIGQVFLSSVQAFGVSRVYLFFALVCFASVTYVPRALVETKGRSLEEIELAMAQP